MPHQCKQATCRWCRRRFGLRAAFFTALLMLAVPIGWGSPRNASAHPRRPGRIDSYCNVGEFFDGSAPTMWGKWGLARISANFLKTPNWTRRKFVPGPDFHGVHSFPRAPKVGAGFSPGLSGKATKLCEE